MSLQIVLIWYKRNVMEISRLNVTLEATAPFALDFYITTLLRTCVSRRDTVEAASI